WVVESYDRDAATVYSPAEQFEQVGALLSAADAAAWAGVLFSPKFRLICVSAVRDRVGRP
ncbi:MAG TPA: hypothetical protein VF874_04065, partial [Mycobacterium sp.]